MEGEDYGELEKTAKKEFISEIDSLNHDDIVESL